MNFFQIHTLKYILLRMTDSALQIAKIILHCKTHISYVLQLRVYYSVYTCNSTLHYYTNCALCSICIVECSGNLTGISGLLLLSRVRTIPKPLQHSFVL